MLKFCSVGSDPVSIVLCSGYDTMDKKTAAGSKESAAAKWVNNYVPYGDHPKGGEAGRQVHHHH